MPFDGEDFVLELTKAFEVPTNPALIKMDQVIDYLRDPNHWCQGMLRSPDYNRHCLVGAMELFQAEDALRGPILQAINEGHRRWKIFAYPQIEPFNDRRTTTHEDVMCVLGRAREIITAG